MKKTSILTLALLASPWACSADKGKSQAQNETTAAEPVKPAAFVPVRRELSAEQQGLLFDSPITTLAGEATTVGAHRGKVLMIVNVASECGLTPQYEQLQGLQSRYEAQGFTVIAFPCNQFGGQEPGTPDEILAFGKEKYDVTFPMMQKLDTNGEARHPIYKALTILEDHKGEAGDVEWNFEKFVVSKDGAHAARIRPEIAPDDAAVVELIEAELAK